MRVEHIDPGVDPYGFAYELDKAGILATCVRPYRNFTEDDASSFVIEHFDSLSRLRENNVGKIIGRFRNMAKIKQADTLGQFLRAFEYIFDHSVDPARAAEVLTDYHSSGD